MITLRETPDPPGEERRPPVEEPDEKPHSEPNAPVREPGPTPPEQR